MDQAFQKLVEQAPWAAAMLGLTWMLLGAAAKERAERIANAKESSDRQRSHELEINNLWANTVKNMIDRQDVSIRAVIDAIKVMHDDLNEQYKNMGITKDLYEAAKRTLSKRGD